MIISINFFRRKAGIAAAFSTILLAGCGTNPGLTVTYAPLSTKAISGNINVGSFAYLPSNPGTPKAVPADVIRNTAMGEIKIDKNVSAFVRDAVFLELRAMGAKMNHPSKTLSGEIEEFLIDDLGYSIDWTLRIKYTITEQGSSNVVYQAVKNTQRKTAKFGNPLGALNETIKINVEQLTDDADFVNAIK
jgi:uncharacterized lipoprotein